MLLTDLVVKTPLEIVQTRYFRHRIRNQSNVYILYTSDKEYS